jgi:hypothetical protein
MGFQRGPLAESDAIGNGERRRNIHQPTLVQGHSQYRMQMARGRLLEQLYSRAYKAVHGPRLMLRGQAMLELVCH